MSILCNMFFNYRKKQRSERGGFIDPYSLFIIKKTISMKNIDLILPRDQYAPERESWNNWPVIRSNWAEIIAEILRQNWKEVNYLNANTVDIKTSAPIVMISLTWATSLQPAKHIIDEIRKDRWIQLPIYVWWAVMMQQTIAIKEDGQYTRKQVWITNEQLRKLFWENVFNGMIPEEFAKIVKPENNPSHFKVSLKNRIESMSDDEFLANFGSEFALFTAQWCNKACSFCTAANRQTEQFKDMKILEEELDTIFKRSVTLWNYELSSYFSNLDFFQTPAKLKEIVDILERLYAKYPKISYKFRWLAQTCSFVNMYEKHNDLIKKLVKLGLTNIGYWVDWMDTRVREGIRKPQNSEEEALATIQYSNELWIIPELLMIIWHPWIDTEETLNKAYQFAVDMRILNNAVIRPYPARSFSPLNEWRAKKEYAETINFLLENPEYFQANDYRWKANQFSHPNSSPEFIEMINKYYKLFCELSTEGDWSTNPIEVILPHHTESEKQQIRLFNQWKYDR